MIKEFPAENHAQKFVSRCVCNRSPLHLSKQQRREASPQTQGGFDGGLLPQVAVESTCSHDIPVLQARQRKVAVSSHAHLRRSIVTAKIQSI